MNMVVISQNNCLSIVTGLIVIFLHVSNQLKSEVFKHFKN